MTSDSGDTSPTNTPPTKSANTLLQDINSLLLDEDIADINLLPENTTKSDGVSCVPAIKAILAARSPVFRRMLYGEFRETRRPHHHNEDDGEEEEGNVEVKLDYSGRVLQLLVEFCFTDKLSSLNNNASTSSGGNSGSTDTASNNSNFTLEEKARLLTNLSGAAHYFDIPKLENDIKVQLNAMMMEHPSVSCAILDEASKLVSGEELSIISMERIRARPKAALLIKDGSASGDGRSGAVSPTFASITAGAGGNISSNSAGQKGGVTSLNASLLEQVIFDDQSTASELTKFLCLQKWVKGCKHEVTLEDVESPMKRLDSDEIIATRTPTKAPRKQMSSNLPSTPGGGEQCTTPQPDPQSPPSKSQSSNSLESTTPETQRERRLTIAKHLASKLDLSLIPASDLSTSITDSNLISMHDLYQAYRLQALNAERTKSKVFVEGAGLAEVNGTYIQRGVHEGTPMYNKEGVWRDREEVFRIFLCTYSNGNKSWCLSIVPKGKEPGKTTDLDFYECPVSYGKGGGIASGSYGGSGSENNGLGMVPSRGWKLVNYGQPPVPKCSLIAGCLEDV